MRHGNTFEKGQEPLQIGLKTDLALTSFGRLQAEKMAAYLKLQNTSLKMVFSGELKRQVESAKIIAEALDVPLTITPFLNEIDYGLWEGISSAEIEKRWPQEYLEWNEHRIWQPHIFLGSEKKLLEDLNTWLVQIETVFHNQTVLAVTSNGLFRFWKKEKIKTGHFCELIKKDSTTGVEKETLAWKIMSWNQAPETL